MSFVLVVSPEVAIHQSMEKILGKDHALLQARSGHEAIALAANHPVDVVVMDPRLPDTSGSTLAERLRRLSEDLNFILITPTDQKAMLDVYNGDVDYEVVATPLQVEEVRWAIRRALERSRLSRELRVLKTRLKANGLGHPFPVQYRGEDVPFGAELSPWFPQERKPPFPQQGVKEFFRALTHITDLEKLLEFMLQATCEMFQVNRACILLGEPSRLFFRPKASIGMDEAKLKSLVLSLEEGLGGWLLRFNQIVKREEVELSGFTKEGATVLKEMDALDAKICAPLFTKGRLVGILTLGNKVTGRPFTDSDVEYLSMLTNYAAVAVENSLLYRELYLQKKYSENILKSIGSGVVAIDHMGRVTTYNPSAERILGLPREEVLGKSVQRLGSVLADLLLRTLDGTDIFSRHEVTHPLTKAPLGVSTSPLKDDSNRIRGAIMVFTDLTESKELEARTRDLERLRFWSTLANRMAQEIRNPLVAVRTFAQLLPQRYGDPEFRQEFFSVVMAEVDRLHQMTERLMEFAMPRESRLSRHDLNEIVQSAVTSRSSWLQAKGLRLVSHLATEPIYVMADPEHMEKAICHILDNAIEATQEGGKVRIRTQRISAERLARRGCPRPFQASFKEWAEVLVEDTGCGIPRDCLPEIFSPFFSTKVKGMGLGLPIARRIVQDHGGRIEAESDPGKGSKFRILLPLDKGREVAGST
jgi:PAS domain S-box-containing protein